MSHIFLFLATTTGKMENEIRVVNAENKDLLVADWNHDLDAAALA